MLAVLEIPRVDYQRLCERMRFANTLDDGKKAKIGRFSRQSETTLQ